MYKYIAITGRIDNLNSFLAADPKEVAAEHRLAYAAPALRLALQACVDARDQRSRDLSFRLDDPAHIASARQLLAAV